MIGVTIEVNGVETIYGVADAVGGRMEGEVNCTDTGATVPFVDDRCADFTGDEGVTRGSMLTDDVDEEDEEADDDDEVVTGATDDCDGKLVG